MTRGPEPVTLHGRDAERAALAELIAAARTGRSGARGPGVGKTGPRSRRSGFTRTLPALGSEPHPFRRVVVGAGGSRAGDALALAERLVAPADARLIFAAVEVHHSFRLPRHHAARDAAAGLAALRERVTAAIPVEEVTRAAASVPRGLTEIAEELHADLVVLGSSEPVAEGHVTPGRTGLRLLQGAPCAVAVAPAGATGEGPFRHVAIAYDGSPEAAAALAAGYAVAARDAAAVSLFWVSPGQGSPGTSPSSVRCWRSACTPMSGWTRRRTPRRPASTRVPSCCAAIPARRSRTPATGSPTCSSRVRGATARCTGRWPGACPSRCSSRRRNRS